MDLRDLTTLRVGGPATRLIDCATASALITAATACWQADEEWFVLGGGSNVVVSDEGFDGTVLRVLTTGIEQLPDAPGNTVILRVQAGESWDSLVAQTVERGLAGLEALSGIPGSTGAAPIQNIGAYGQELSSVLDSLEFLDYLTGQLVRLTPAELQFGYRWSVLKGERRGVVVSVDLRLVANAGGLSDPIAYPQLAAALGVEVGERMPVAEVRAAVLALRASKGMILDANDPDSVSAGSFFTNPIVSREFARSLPVAAPRWDLNVDDASPQITPLEFFVPPGSQPAKPEPVSGVKLSAAWLIENCGISRGFSLPGSRAAISSKHTLAIVNTGEATAEQIAELARYVQTRVLGSFGVVLNPEPILLGVQV